MALTLSWSGFDRRPRLGDGGFSTPGRYRAAPSVPAITHTPTSGQMLRLAFSTMAGYRYELEVSDDLASDGWSPTGDVFDAGNGNGSSFDKPASAGRRFYRIRVR